jgi:hypothetical protein
MGRSSDSPTAVASTPAERRQSRRRIDDEHRRLRELLHGLVRTHQLERVDALLAQLEKLLLDHFAVEEAPEGMHDIVSAGAAHRLPNLQRLFVEHREILARLERLRSEVAACLSGPLHDIHEGVAELAEQLRRHEAAEDELFGEAFYLDIGGRS